VLYIIKDVTPSSFWVRTREEEHIMGGGWGSGPKPSSELFFTSGMGLPMGGDRGSHMKEKEKPCVRVTTAFLGKRTSPKVRERLVGT